MESNKAAFDISKEDILRNLVDILKDMTSDWDLEYDGQIGEGTKLIEDLSFESIDIVQLVVAIEEKFKRRGMPYEELLMEDGRYVDEVVVGDVVEFLFRRLKN